MLRSSWASEVGLIIVQTAYLLAKHFRESKLALQFLITTVWSLKYIYIYIFNIFESTFKKLIYIYREKL